MGAIEHEIAVVGADFLKPPRPFGGGEPSPRRGVWNPDASGVDEPECGNCRAGILDLMGALQAQFELPPASPRTNRGERFPRSAPGPVVTADKERDVQRGGLLADCCLRLGDLR